MRALRHASITWRLTLLFALASASVLLGLGVVIATAVEQHFEEQDRHELNGKMALTRHTLALLNTADDLSHVTHMLDSALVGHHGLELLVLTPQRETLYATAGAGFAPDLVVTSARQHQQETQTWNLGARSYRAIAAELPSGVSTLSPLTVAVATDIAHHQAFMQSFQRTLWAFVVGAALLSGLLGWAAARRGLAPLRGMREQAQVVTAQQLGHRLELAAMPIELAELAQSLNDMLARLEEAFARLSSFSSDIAHELRTPVSNLMTQTQVALSRARSADDYRGILESNAEEFEHLARMISDMLLLAKADNGLVLPHRETVHLANEVRALFDYYEAVADEKGLQLVLEGEADVSADRLMLRRALGNLLSNAVRHAATHSSVRVHIDATPDAVCITTENTGEVIRPEHLERIFDRFFRVDPSRQRSGEGTGLGLAITRSIVLAHGGSIGVNCSKGITTFTMRLPR